MDTSSASKKEQVLSSLHPLSFVEMVIGGILTLLLQPITGVINCLLHYGQQRQIAAEDKR